MSDSEMKSSATVKPAAVRKPRAKKVETSTVDATAQPKVRKPRAVAADKPTRARKAAASAKRKVSPEQRREMIATAAYFIAEKRGFHHGYDHDDWLAAEKEVDATIEQA